MGSLSKREPVKWTEELMQQKLLHFRSTPRYALQNLYVFGWESDILFLSKSGYWTEIEIKVSRSDFKADLKNKVGKHWLLSDPDNKLKPNQFFYAAPRGLIHPDEVPEYAGLLTVSDRCFGADMQKPAPWLHRRKIDPNELDLTDKFYYNMVNAKRESLIARRTAENLTDSYRQGYEEGHRMTVNAVLRLMGDRCPHREMAEQGRIHCRELDQTKFRICNRGLCRYLEQVEELLSEYFKETKEG